MKRLLLVIYALYILNVNAAVNNISPKNTVYATDFHGVLADFSVLEVFKTLTPSNILHIPKLVTRVFRYCKSKLMSDNDTKLTFDYVSCNSNDPEAFKKFKTEIANSHRPNEDQIEFIQNLIDCGYKVIICSNISEESLNYMKNKYKDLKNLIDNNNIAIVHPTQKNGYANKMSTELYEELRKVAKQTLGRRPEYLIFVDNSSKKIKVAESTNKNFESQIIGIKYKSLRSLKYKLSQFLDCNICG